MVKKRCSVIARVDPGEKSIVVTGAEHHHLAKVRRVKEGGDVTVLDGSGGIYETRVARLSRDTAILHVRSYRKMSGPPAIDMALAMTKAHRLDFAVEKCTEIGVRRFIPFTADRSVWRGGEKEAARKQDRLQRKVLAACKQSGNPYFPAVEDLLDFNGLLAVLDEYAVVCIADREGRPLTSVTDGSGQGRILGIVGPEGGFSDGERSELVGAGALAVSLGPHVLRSETAAICLLVRLHDRFSAV
jgi:16S rRNA (uracil1498-N3)-methyltransferase